MTTAIKFTMSAKDHTKGAFKSLTGSLRSAKAGIAALIGVGGMGALIKSSLDTVDALAKTSDRLGIATEALAGLQHAANQTGVSTEALNMGLQRMTRRIGQVAATGKGEAKVALDQLGISIDALKGKRPEEQFALIAEKMKDVDDQGQKVFLTQKLFDSEGVKLLNTLNLGADGLQRMMDDAETLGLAVSRVDAAKIEAANDSLDRVKKQFAGISNLVTAQLAPFISALSDEFVRSANNAGNAQESIASAFEKTGTVIGVFADGIHGIKVLFQGLKVVAMGFSAAFLKTLEVVVNKGLVPFANTLTNTVLYPFRQILEAASGFSDTAKTALEALNGLGNAEGFKFLEGTAAQAMQNLNGSLSEMHNLMMQELPSEVLKEKLERVVEEAKSKALEATAEIRAKVGTGQQDLGESTEELEKDNDQKVEAEKKYQDQITQIQANGSKKMLAIQKAIKLKQAVVSGFTAIQEAWASAPFPANLPAVAITTAAQAANIAGIKGVAHSGIDNVPREGTWLLDKGERVVDRRTNADLKDFLNGGGTSNNNQNVTLNVSLLGNDSKSFVENFQDNMKPLMRMIQASMSAPI